MRGHNRRLARGSYAAPHPREQSEKLTVGDPKELPGAHPRAGRAETAFDPAMRQLAVGMTTLGSALYQPEVNEGQGRTTRRSPRTAAAVCLAAAATAALAMPATAQAARFSGYVACGIDDGTYSPPGRHVCSGGDQPYAVFRDRRRSGTRYRKCVTVPSGRTYCATHRTGPAGSPSQRPLRVDALGPYHVKWYVGGRLVRTWGFQMQPEVEGHAKQGVAARQAKSCGSLRIMGDRLPVRVLKGRIGCRRARFVSSVWLDPAPGGAARGWSCFDAHGSNLTVRHWVSYCYTPLNAPSRSRIKNFVVVFEPGH